MLTWTWNTFDELTPRALYDILALRMEVFMLEQKCLYPELDYNDQDALHLLGTKNGKLVAYLRLLPKDYAYPGAVSFGRVVSSPSVRGEGIGKKLMLQVLAYLEQQNNTVPIIIYAQLYLQRFYESFGFKIQGESYLEDDIPHIQMVKQ